MNKKFLNAILFGALILGSAGTIMSCKDYDDEIDDINSKIANLATTSDLTSQISSLQTSITAATTQASQAATEAANAVTAAQNAATAAQEAYDAAVAAGSTAAIAEAAAKKATADAEVAKTTAEKAAADLKAADLAQLSKTVADLKTKLENLPSGLSEDDWQKIKDEVAAAVEKANSLLGTQLTSLVFRPDFYYWGIEAMPAYTFSYNALTVKKVDADNDYSSDAPTAAKTATNVTPGLVADYHLNPSTVDIKNITDLTFLAADKAFTRADNGVTVKVTGKELAEPGILRVHAALTGDIKSIADDEAVTVLALQAHYTDAKVDTIVTSDYAAVKKFEIKDIVLANAKVQPAHEVGANKGHLNTTAKAAIDDEVEVQVEWNSEGIDLADYVETHYTNGDDADVLWENVEKDGFAYSYELVGYFSGDNETSESAHAALNGSILRPQITKGGKQQAFGYDQSEATVGRKPLVRVKLTDTNTKNVVAVGYILAEIVYPGEAEAEDAVDTFGPFVIGDDYTVSCSTDDLVKKLKWHEVEEQILAKLSISKDRFENNYKLDDNDDDALQFDATTAKAKEVKKVGKVSKTTTDTEAQQTEVLQWTVGANEAYEAFTKQPTIKAIVRFVKENANGTHHYVYVTFEWTPANRNIAPAGTIADSNKLDYAWYASNTTVAKSGFDEIHQNVKVPNIGEDDSKYATYKNDILNAFVGNKVTVSGVDKVYEDFQAEDLTVTFKFIKPAVTKVWGVGKHNQYLLTISEDGLTMNATLLDKDGKTTGAAQAVAVLDGSVITYQETDYAKDVLNYAGRNEMGAGETLAGRIGIEATNGCDKEVALTNNEFDVKFIRPIEILPIGKKNLSDAVNDGDKIDFADVIGFRDWRNDDNWAIFSPEGYNYYKYYGIEKIEVDKDQITCDLNGKDINTTLLKDMSPNIDVELVGGDDPDAIAEGDFGQLVYKNNGNEVGTYHIGLPVKVTYKWGVIEQLIIVEVKGTI